jgi:hypothetical protein
VLRSGSCGALLFWPDILPLSSRMAHVARRIPAAPAPGHATWGDAVLPDAPDVRRARSFASALRLRVRPASGGSISGLSSARDQRAITHCSCRCRPLRILGASHTAGNQFGRSLYACSRQCPYMLESAATNVGCLKQKSHS